MQNNILKLIKMNYNYVEKRNVYAWIDGALRQVKINRQEMFNGRKPVIYVDYKGIEGGYRIETENEDVFDSIEGYKANNPSKLSEIYPHAIGCTCGVEESWIYYVQKNGRVLEMKFDGKVVLEYDSDNVRKFSSPDLPSEYYRSKETALGMLDFKAINEDGSEVEVKGAIRKILLTDDQKKLVGNFVDAYKKLKDAGVKLYFERDSDRVIAVNGANASVSSDYDYEMKDNNDGEEKVDAYGDEMYREFDVPIELGFLNEEYHLWVK